MKWNLKFVHLFILLMFLQVSVIQSPTQDSVDVSFRYETSGKSSVYVTGEFIGWNPTALPMNNVGGDLWTRTERLAIGGNPNPPAVGIPGAWQYKFYTGDTPWPNDPLNHHVNPKDNDNTYLFVEDPTIYHFLPNQRTGIVQTNTPNISAYLYPEVASLVDTSILTIRIDDTTYTNIGSFYNFVTQQLVFTPPNPLTDGSHVVILDAGTNADTVNFFIQTQTPQIVPMPSYAKHGVTLPSAMSNDSTTFRIRLGNTNVVILRVAPAGQPVASAPAQIMRKDPDSDNWWINLNLAPGTYEYLYQSGSGTSFYDPWGRWNGAFGSRFTVGPEGLTADDYEWQSTDYQRPPLNRLIIYELNLGEFVGGFLGLSGTEANFTDLIPLLTHLDSLGINAIELMPINDFASVGSSGFFSWGYDLNSYFALEPAYGTPREFKTLVDSAHALGMAVIVDVIFNHMNDTGPLWQMQPDFDLNPYFKDYDDLRPNEDALFFFKDIDHWTDETQEIVYESLKMWIDEYRVDGFRYDFTQGIGWNVNEPDKGILGWTGRIEDDYNRNIIQIAEHLPESPALIFHSGLTGGWHDSFRDKVFDEARFRNVSLTDFENLVLDLGAFPSNDVPSSPSIYTNRSEPTNMNVNHDEQSLIYEMTTFQGVPLDEAIVRDKLYATFMFTSLGIPLLWQGMEFSAPRGWMNEGQKLSYRPLEWNLLPTQRGQDHFQHYKKLIYQRKNNPALFRGILRRLFKYNTERVLVWGFEDVASTEKIMAVANLSGAEQTVSNVPWLAPGDWYNIFDNSVLSALSTTIPSVTIPEYTCWVYSNSPDSLLPIQAIDQTLSTEFTLSQNYPNPFNPETTIDFEIPRSVKVTIAIFNNLGQIVKILTNEIYPAGRYRVKWNGTNTLGEKVGSGVYILKFKAGDFAQNRRLVLMK
jgi:1,4-alpha-glucan branching enzyme